MSRGPDPKPTILKLIAGNPGKRPLNENEPQPPEGSPVPPNWLREDALAIWNELVPPLVETKLATAIDWPLIGRYCVKLARWIYLGEQINKAKTDFPESKGTTYPILDEKGKPRYVAEFPWASEWRALDRDLRADEARIGIGAAARSRLTVVGGKEKSKDQDRRNFFNQTRTGA